MQISTIQQYINEVKGAPLYQTQSIPSNVIAIKDKFEDDIRNKLYLDKKDVFINLIKSAKNYVLSARFVNDHAMTPADVKDFASKYKQYGDVQIKQEAKSVYDPLYDEESNYLYDFYVKILIPIAKKDLQTVMKFIVPNISHTTDITTKQQKENGTIAIEDDLTGYKYFLYSSGYVRCRRVDARPGSPDSNLMLPGGGTPDEMVKCMIKSIERTRAKSIKSYNESRVLDEIKGTPLYKTRLISPEAGDAKNKIEQKLLDLNVDLRRRDVTVNLSAGPKNDVITITFRIVNGNLPMQEFINFCKQFGVVKRARTERYETVTVSIAKSKDLQQDVIDFVIPNIPYTTDVTTDKQRQNGTVAIEDDMTGDTYFLQSSGYVRCRRAHSRPGLPHQNLMAPGGGTPDEMVKCMIRAIERARTKPITHYESITRQDVKLALQEIKRRHAAVK
jgi:hypothetical protein